MKKIYEAPKMLVEVVCVEELLSASAGSGVSIMDSDTKVSTENDSYILGKDRDNSDWGGLW